MNWLDRAIDWVSPQSGLQRARCRSVSQALLAYEGVRSERRQGGWNTSGTSGNAEIGPRLGKLRDNGRDFTRNNPYGRRAPRDFAKRVVGTGIGGRAATGYESIDAVINERWAQFSRRCMSDRRIVLGAAQKLMVSSAFTSGDVLIRRWVRRPEDGLAVPLQLQILESDYLDHSKTQSTPTGYIIQGVDFSHIGEIR